MDAGLRVQSQSATVKPICDTNGAEDVADPFQNVDAAGPEFIRLFADSMDVRQADPTMEAIVADFLGRLNLGPGNLLIEVGAGAGAVTRRIAAHAAPAQVIGFEPSQGFVDEAILRATGHENLRFEVADGADLPLTDDCADAVIMHTVLSHVVDPMPLIAEATRVLKPGGALVVCDADFSKASLASFENDPLDACAREFVRHFVTDAHIIGKLRGLLKRAGLQLDHFDATSRVVMTAQQMLPWVDLTAQNMAERGDIGPELAAALVAEHNRRAENGSLYGHQVFGTAIAHKP